MALLMLVMSGAGSLASGAQTENGRLDAIENLYHQGRWNEGISLADPNSFQTEEAKVAARYFRALGLMQLGRPDLAVPQLRSILADHPRFERVRLTLAQALSAIGDEAGARHHFELLLGAGLEPNLDRQIRSTLATLESGKNWTLSAHFSVIPSTNINSGTDNDRVEIGGIAFTPSESSKQQSGTGAQYGVDAGYRMPLSPNWSLTAKAGVTRKDYSNSEADETKISGAFGILNNTPMGYWGIEAISSRTWGADPVGEHKPAIDTVGGRAYGRFVPSSAWRIDLASEVVARNYHFSKHLDGYRASAHFNIDRIIDSRSFARVLGAGVYEGARRDDLTFHDLTAGAGYFREWNWGISTYLQGSVSGRWYHGDFSFAGEPREDLRATALLRVAKRDLTVLGFAPYAQASYTVNRSNIDLYDYNKLDIDLGWTRTF